MYRLLQFICYDNNEDISVLNIRLKTYHFDKR